MPSFFGSKLIAENIKCCNLETQQSIFIPKDLQAVYGVYISFIPHSGECPLGTKTMIHNTKDLAALRQML